MKVLNALYTPILCGILLQRATAAFLWDRNEGEASVPDDLDDRFHISVTHRYAIFLTFS